MATKKDLVDAQSFSRRRLTTAFVSGAPGGREVEPHRPLRAVAGGLALTVVLVLGSMAFGWLRSSLPDDWKNDRLIIAEDSGARYVSIKEVLHPVVNTTSARLLIPSAQFKVLAVPDDELASIKRGPTLGILGAPDSLTPAASLVNSGWVSCLEEGELVSTAIGRQRTVTPAADGAVVVRNGKRTFVIANGRRYPVATRDVSSVTVALRLDGRPAIDAPSSWLNLFPEGPALGPLTIDDLGKSAPGPARRRDGRLGPRPRGRRRGPPLPRPAQRRPRAAAEVATEMYRLGSGASGREVPVQAAQIRQLEVRPQSFAPTEWPDEIPTADPRHPVRDPDHRRQRPARGRPSGRAPRPSPTPSVAARSSTPATAPSSGRCPGRCSTGARCSPSTRPPPPTRSRPPTTSSSPASATGPPTSRPCRRRGPRSSGPAPSSAPRPPGPWSPAGHEPARPRERRPSRRRGRPRRRGPRGAGGPRRPRARACAASGRRWPPHASSPRRRSARRASPGTCPPPRPR